MTQAIFLSYASQDADAARRICDALRAKGLEVWFDQSELRGGDAWDASIRKQIKECLLFVPIISTNTDAREEGYFRLEWKLAVDRTHLMAETKPFLFPVLLEGCTEQSAVVPEVFRTRQWTKLGTQTAIDAFAEQIARVGSAKAEPVHRQQASGEGGAEPEASRSQQRTPARARRGVTPWVAGVVAALVAVGAYLGYRQLSPQANKSIESIAVLPLQTSSSAADNDTDYLSVGLAETLIYQLSRLPNLKVSPASSIYRYKGREVDAQKAGAELGVSAVLTGRLVQRGESLSISVELVDVRHQKSLWGEKYERKMADLLATQRDISTEIARNLQVRISGETAQAMSKRYTSNNDAYQAYLKGRYLYMKRGRENLARSVEHYREAVRLDPRFALAYVGIADTYAFLSFFGGATDAIVQASLAAEKALSIDPELAEAHSSQASLATVTWDWDKAERGYKRALALDDSIGSIHYFYALNYLLPNGRIQEAIAHIDRALALEPMSIPYAANLARAYSYAGQNEKALTQARKVYALEPTHPAAQGNLLDILIVNGKSDEAIRLQEAVQPTSRGTSAQESLALAYALAGRAEDARKMWSDRDRQRSRLAIAALVEDALGERDRAFTILDAAIADKDFELAYINVDPRYASLKRDPRFAGVVKRIGLKS